MRDALGHLGVGAGVGWPAIINTPVSEDPMQATPRAVGEVGDIAGDAAFAQFVPELLTLLDTIDPSSQVHVPGGTEPARYWVAHAAGEFAVHAYDVAGALDEDWTCSDDEALDGLAWACRYILPFGFAMINEPPPRPVELVASTGSVTRLGDGDPVASVAGTPTALFLAAWGRPNHRSLSTDGDHPAAEAWLGITSRSYQWPARG